MEIEDKREINKEGFDLEEMVKFRKWMHQNPELSLKEFKTISKIKEMLLNIGIPEENIKTMAETGLIMDLQGEGPEKGQPLKIALRSEHDALPIEEENPDLPYESKNGCSHMCGHDGHTTCLLSAVWLIKQNLDKIPKNRSFRAIFQPGEEGFRGAQKMVDAGCLEGVDEIYGMHNRPRIASNKDHHKIVVTDGCMHSHCNFFFIEVRLFLT